MGLRDRNLAEVNIFLLIEEDGKIFFSYIYES